MRYYRIKAILLINQCIQYTIYMLWRIDCVRVGFCCVVCIAVAQMFTYSPRYAYDATLWTQMNSIRHKSVACNSQFTMHAKG